MALPAQVTYATVNGVLTSAVVDGSDVDLLPDAVPLSGQVTFTPDRVNGQLLVPTATPPLMVTVRPMPFLLAGDGSFSANLVVIPGATYTVSFALNNGVVIAPFSIGPLVAGTTYDLASLAPVTALNGVQMTKGDKGDPGTASPSTDASVAAAITTPGTATKAALTVAFAGKADAGRGVSHVLTKMLTGQGVKVTFLGDSGLEGNSATTPGTDDAASLLCTDLAARFGVAVTKSNRASSGHCAYWHLMPSVLSPTRYASALADAADLYVISTGHNDIRSDLTATPNTGYPLAASMGALEHMIRRIRIQVPGADILLANEWPYTSTSTPSNPALVAHSKAMSRLAAHYGCGFVDFTAALTALGVTGSNAAVDDLYIWPTGGSGNAQHPTSAGHRVWADTMLAFLPAGFSPSAQPPNAVPPGLFAPDRYGGWVTIATAPGGVRPNGTDGYRVVNGWSDVINCPTTSSTVGGYIDVQFIGTECSLRIDTGTGQGTVKVTIDGTDVFPSLPLTGFSTGQGRFPFTGLTPGYHRIIITILSGSVTFRGMDFLPAACEKIKHDSTRITYTGTWAAQVTDASRYFGTSNLTTVNGDSFTLDFVGTALAMMYARYTTFLTVGVTIDGVALTDLDAAGATLNGVTSSSGLVLAFGLPYGRHTATITLKSAGRSMNVHGLTVYDETRTDRPTLIRGVAKVAEVITLATPLPGVPDVRLVPADAASTVPPYPSARTASGFTVGGTATALVGWEAESGRAAW